MKLLLSFAAVALLTAGCSTPQPCACAQQDVRAPAARTDLRQTVPKGPALSAAPSQFGTLPGWSSYRDFTFAYNLADILGGRQAADELAAYAAANPSLIFGIDGSMDAYGRDPHDQKLTDQRVLAVRSALMAAGIPGENIRTGTFGDPKLRRDRRVAVLVSIP